MDIGQEKENEAESMLRTQFKMELNVYTQDTTYLTTMIRLCPSLTLEASNPGATLNEMMRHVKSYQEVSVVEMLQNILVGKKHNPDA